MYTTNSKDFLKDSSFKKYIKTHYKPILDIANILYEKILKQVQNDILFSSQKNTPYYDVSKMSPGITEV